MMQVLGLPVWGQFLLEGILLFVEISAAAVVLTRVRRNPYFAFLIIIPYVQILAIWYLAFSKWPKKTEDNTASTPAIAS